MLSVCLQPPPWTCWKSEGTLAEPAAAIVSVYFSWGEGLLFCRRGINEGNILGPVFTQDLQCLHGAAPGHGDAGVMGGRGCTGMDPGVLMERALTAPDTGMGFNGCECKAIPVASPGTCEEESGAEQGPVTAKRPCSPPWDV